MYHFPRLYVLVITITIYIVTNASPALSLARATPMSLNFNATGVECFPPTDSRRTTSRDCLDAVLSLRKGSRFGRFHPSGSGPPDLFALPVVKRYNSCMATVSISNEFQDYSSWFEISQFLNQLTALCSTGQYPLGMTGGIAYIGEYQLIQVTVERNRQIALDIGNGTFEVITTD